MIITAKDSWSSAVRYTFPEVETLLQAEIAQLENIDNMTEANKHGIAKVLCLIGSQGIGKSTFIREFAADNGLDFTCLYMGSVALEDNLPIPTPSKDEKEGHFIWQAHPDFPSHTPHSKKKLGICLVTDAATADVKQINQLRALISDRRLGYMQIADGWIIVLDENPETSEFTSVNRRCASVDSRIVFLPVEADYENWMRYASKEKLMPRDLYAFLRVYRKYWKDADPRRWAGVGNTLLRHEDQKLDKDLSWKYLRSAVGDVITTHFKTFVTQGSDPMFFPILGEEWMQADEKEHKEHVKRIKHWVKEAGDAAMPLLGATFTDILAYVDRNKFLDEQASTNLVDLFEHIKNDQISVILQNVTASMQAKMFRKLTGTPIGERLTKICKALQSTTP